MNATMTDGPSTVVATGARTSTFRLGLFGDTRSGKTVYLSSLIWLARNGQLPAGLANVREADGDTARYLGEKVAMLSAGKWPAGSAASSELHLLVDRDSGEVLTITTADFRGGDLADAFYGGDRRAAVRFVSRLFDGCNAYMFLLDPSAIVTGNIGDTAARDGDLDSTRADEQQRRLGGIMPALEILRHQSWRIRAFHPPVAIVFTKCDRFPEAQQNPEQFAKDHALQIWRHLRTHLPGKHRFFALSSTGPCDGSTNAAVPPDPLKPQAVAEPILWLAQMHAKRARAMQRIVGVVILLLALCGFTGLHALNARDLGVKWQQVPTATADELRDMYVAVKGWQGLSRFALTHPIARKRLLGEILNHAEQAATRDYESRLDGAGDLRTLLDLQETHRCISAFEQRYRGTEPANRLNTWLEAQRLRLASIALVKMRKAAADGDQYNFDVAQREFYQTGCRTLDPEVKNAEAALWAKISAEATKRLWAAWLIRRQHVDYIRDKCRDAEEELGRNPRPRRADQDFVSLVRTTYDDLHKNGLWPKLTFRLEAGSDAAIYWKVCVKDEYRNESGVWQKPLKTEAGNWYALQCNFTYFLLHDTDTKFIFYLTADRWGPWTDEYFTRTYNSEEFANALRSGCDWAKGSAGNSMKISFIQDEPYKLIVRWYNAVKKIEETGDELFRSAR